MSNDLVARLEAMDAADTPVSAGEIMREASIEIERLRAALQKIADTDDETDEWDAVDKFTACRQAARDALPALEHVDGK